MYSLGVDSTVPTLTQLLSRLNSNVNVTNTFLRRSTAGHTYRAQGRPRPLDARGMAQAAGRAGTHTPRSAPALCPPGAQPPEQCPSDVCNRGRAPSLSLMSILDRHALPRGLLWVCASTVLSCPRVCFGCALQLSCLAPGSALGVRFKCCALPQGLLWGRCCRMVTCCLRVCFGAGAAEWSRTAPFGPLRCAQEFGIPPFPPMLHAHYPPPPPPPPYVVQA